MKQNHSNVDIIGYDLNQANERYLLNQHLIDQSMTFQKASQIADIIILAGPVNVILRQIHVLSNLKLKSNVLITDVGSTKTSILKQSKQLTEQGIHFLGGHPMAGSQKSGSKAGWVNLFNHTTYFLVRSNATIKQIKLFKSLLDNHHIHFVFVSAFKHDQMVGYISHLPHALAFSLVHLMDQKLHGELKQIQVGGGLLSTTRIAAADPTMWSNIFMNNKNDLIKQIDDFQKQLNDLKMILQKQNPKQIKQYLEQSQNIRQRMDWRKS
ncbi:prephenate dehydrogenase [Philodulcilactobacillus myokoensis]|uniref:prephenate dehydrogenase n=1 Tax=Philodulcilactobacillus myokoensis TaxID=2929573 RepID=UPI0035A23B63